MDINNIQALIAQGLITDVASVDPNKAYVAVGVYQPGNRQSGPAGNAYPSYAMPISEFLSGAGVLTGAQNGLSLAGTVAELGGTLIHTTDVNINGYSMQFSNGVYPILFLDPGKQQVAIGGNNPTAMLDITAVGSGTVGLKLNTASTEDAVLRFGTNNSTYSGLGFRAKIWVEDATQTLNFYTNTNNTIFWNGNGGVQTKTFTLFTDTTAKFENNIGIGADPVTNGRVQINNSVFGKASISLGGADYYGIDVNTTGLSMLLGVNTSNNKQLWLADQDKLASNGTNPILQFSLLGTSPSAINAISTNGSYLDLVLQSNGGNVGISTGVINPTARLHVKGNSTPGNFTFKVENAGGNPLLYVRNDGFVSIGALTIGAAKLEITAGALQGIYITSTAIAINANATGVGSFGIKGETDLGTAIRGQMTNNAGIGLDITNTNTNSILLRVFGNNVTSFNDFDFNIKTVGGVSLLDVQTNKPFLLSMSGSCGDVLSVDNVTGILEVHVPINTIALPTSGLSTGDMYVATAADILSNGDKVVGWKV